MPAVYLPSACEGACLQCVSLAACLDVVGGPVALSGSASIWLVGESVGKVGLASVGLL